LSVQRVAFISFHACPLAAPGQGKSGGMNVYVRQLAQALGNLGIEVDVFTRDHHEADDAIEWISPQARVVHLPGGDPEAPMEDLLSYLPEFLAALQEFRRRDRRDYQGVHSHYWLSGWVGQRLAREMAVPHVITFHTLARIKMQSRAGEREPLQRQQVEQQLMASAQCVVAFSPHERDSMERLYHADRARIKLVPCGVDLDTFQPLDQEESRKRLGLNGDKVLLYVGRIESLKGLDLLVHVAAHMETCHPLRVLVVGGDNGKDRELDRLRRLAEELKVDDKFDFVGRVDQDELPTYYSAADVCVVPSFYESFGLAALESMACGTPVVASRVGGLSTVIQHGSTGYLKSWRCPEAFAHSLEMIISSKRLQDSMGAAARRRAEGLGWDQVAARMAGIYDSLSPRALE
jgi:D-inositol-3-phosphate glycosyltransferase